MFPFELIVDVVMWTTPLAVATLITGEVVKDWKDEHVDRWTWISLALVALAWDVATVLGYLGISPFCIL